MQEERLAAYIRTIVHLNDEPLDVVLSYFKPSSHAAKDVLVRPGEINQYMNFIDEGCVMLFFVRDDGQEVTRHIVFGGLFATGLASFIAQQPSAESLQIMEKSRMLRISRRDFYYLLNLIPAWEKFYRHYLEFAYLNNLNIYQRETTKDAADRYRELLSVNPEVVRRLPNKMVASYLNMSPETLSRMKSKTRGAV